MKILTWNIMVDDSNPERYKRIAEMINKSQVHVVCLQEVSVIAWYCMKDICAVGGWKSLYSSPLSANSSFRTYGEMILYLADDVIIHEAGFFLLPNSKQGRSVQWCSASLLGCKPNIIATGHLESYEINHEVRVEQMDKILSELSLKNRVYWFGDCNMTKEEKYSGIGVLYSYGDTYFSSRFMKGISYKATQPYDRVWTNNIKPQLLSRYGYDSDTSLPMSDHDGLILIIGKHIT